MLHSVARDEPLERRRRQVRGLSLRAQRTGSICRRAAVACCACKIGLGCKSEQFRHSSTVEEEDDNTERRLGKGTLMSESHR